MKRKVAPLVAAGRFELKEEIAIGDDEVCFFTFTKLSSNSAEVTTLVPAVAV